MIRAFRPAAIQTAPALSACVLLLFAATSSAFAQGQAPVETAGDGQTDRQIAAWLADDGDGSEPAAPADAQPPPVGADRAVHGEAEVGFGSNGYRLARVSAVAPLGEDAALGVALADASIGGRRVHAEQKGFALSLRIGQGGVGPADPCGLRHTGVRLAADVRQDALCARAGDDPAALP